MTDIDDVLLVLAEPNRRRIIEALSGRALRAGELAEKVGLTPAALSRHLRTLKANGLIEEISLQHDARVRIYSLQPDPLMRLRAWLNETETRWTRQLPSFGGFDFLSPN